MATQGITRKAFLNTAAATGTAAMVGAFAATASAQEGWDRETEVLVVGFGGSGAVAAATAHEEGADVLILEKAPQGGGSSRLSGGFIAYALDVDRATEFMCTITKGLTPESVCRAWAQESLSDMSWLDEHGIQYIDMPFLGADLKGIPNADAISTCCICGDEMIANMGGPIFYEWAMNYMDENGIEVLYETPATELVQDPQTKEILGVIANSPAGEVRIRAKKAVILCCGGFATNDKMLGNYVRPYPVVSVGWPYDDGDGFKMGQMVGADIWHANLVCSHGMASKDNPQDKVARWETKWELHEGESVGSYIFINRTGKRFVREVPNDMSGHRSFMAYSAWDWDATETMTTPDYRDVPFYCVFDEKERAAGCIYPNQNIALWSIPEEIGGLSPWSDDNLAEVQKGIILKADTLEELAELICADSEGFDFDPSVLRETVNAYNACCKAGVDEKFGREMDAIYTSPIDETGPYYALKFYEGIYSTCGGPVKNEYAQILDVKGNVIPRLYEAGVLGHSSAQVYTLYGQNWAEIMHFGRIAGRNAAAETPIA